MSTTASASSSKEKPRPPGNTGTHIPPPNTYLLYQLTRANYITARRYPFTETGDAFGIELQRHVHYEGNRPPNRKILLFLRLLTYYPPIKDILPELIELLESDNAYVCRLAHYHIRQLCPIYDLDLYRQLIDALQRQSASTSPARRSCATKTYAKIFHPSEALLATDFILDVFNKIGGARIVKPHIPTPGSTTARLRDVGISKEKEKQSRFEAFKQSAAASVVQQSILRAGEIYDYQAIATGADPDAAAEQAGDSKIGGASSSSTTPAEKKRLRIRRMQQDDGTGGMIQGSPTGGISPYLKSRQGKILLVHCTLAALRRINRMATTNARVESYIFDSGLISTVPSAVRHTIALLELRSHISPQAVVKYLLPRLPQKGPPPEIRLLFEDLGARVYFTRLVSSLAEDPNLSRYIPKEAPKQAAENLKDGKNQNRMNFSELKQSMNETSTVKGKANKIFRFLFDKQQINNIVGNVKDKTSNAVSLVTQDALGGSKYKKLIPKVVDSSGVEFAQALVNLIKNSSMRVLLEALRGLSKRKWTTWFESPLPQSALYNAPELKDNNSDTDVNDPWDDDYHIDDDEDGGDDNLNDDDSEDENELGAYENDIRKGKGDDDNESNKSSKRLSVANELDDDNVASTTNMKESNAEKETWLSKLNVRRQERRTERIDTKIPFYLKKVGQGMVPALEVILRRISAALLHDEPIFRFSAVDAIIVLSRAKIYGHTKEDDDMYRKAQGNFDRLRNGANSQALIVAGESNSNLDFSFYDQQAKDNKNHPFQALVRPLSEIIEEDPNAFVRGRAAIALLFVIASGAGHTLKQADDELDVPKQSYSHLSDEDTEKSDEVPVLMKYLGSYVRHPSCGSGIGFKQMSELVDYLVYEILDISPNLCVSALLLVEEWAATHPTIGVCGRLGVVWEKVLSLGYGSIVGKSLIRSIMESGPLLERISCAAVIFLKKRVLDIAVLSIQNSSSFLKNVNIGLPEPLPKDVGVEMEKYFSILWHTIILGPSAECRSFAVESIGGAAVLAGEPFRIGTYERLVELIQVGGFGVRHLAERVLSLLDTLYEVRETFSETRAQRKIPRNGHHKGKEWLEFVWQLRCRAVAAARIALGVIPPEGWLPLGPGAAADVANAEAVFGGDESVGAEADIENKNGSENVQEEQEVSGANTSSVAVTETNNAIARSQGELTKRGEGIAGSSKLRKSGPMGSLGPIGEISDSIDNIRVDDRFDDRNGNRQRPSDSGYDRGGTGREQVYDDHGYEDRDRNRRYDGYGEEGDYNRRMDWYDNENDDGYKNDDRYHEDNYREREERYERRRPNDQEEDDRLLAEQLQREEQQKADHPAHRTSPSLGDGGEEQEQKLRLKQFNIGGSSSSTAAGAVDGFQKQMHSTAQVAERMLKQGVRGGKDLTAKVMKSAARSSALDKLKISPRPKDRSGRDNFGDN